MKNLLVVLLLSLFISKHALSETVLGYSKMVTLYQEHLIGEAGKPKMPKLYVYDTKTKMFVDYEGIKTIFELTSSEEDKIKHFIGNEIALPKASNIPESLPDDFSKFNYLVFYFNLPEDAFGAAVMYHPTIQEDHAFLVQKVASTEGAHLYTSF